MQNQPPAKVKVPKVKMPRTRKVDAGVRPGAGLQPGATVSARYKPCKAMCGLRVLRKELHESVEFRKRWRSGWWEEYCCFRCFESVYLKLEWNSRCRIHGRLCEGACVRCNATIEDIHEKASSSHACADLHHSDAEYWLSLSNVKRASVRFY